MLFLFSSGQVERIKQWKMIKLYWKKNKKNDMIELEY